MDREAQETERDRRESLLDEALEESFPASDPISVVIENRPKYYGDPPASLAGHVDNTKRTIGLKHGGVPIFIAAGIRTPFLKAGGAFAHFDSIALSVPVVKAMMASLKGSKPDLVIWGAAIPDITWSSIACEVLLNAGIDPTMPAFSTNMACSTSMAGVFEAAGMIDGKTRNLALVGGAESMSRIQVRLAPGPSSWVRELLDAKSLGQKLRHLRKLKLSDIRLWIPKVFIRRSGLSMGEHTEITAKVWNVAREEQDSLALTSHKRAVAAWSRGFFDDLVLPIATMSGLISHDGTPCSDTSKDKLAKLKPAFDTTSGRGTLTAGNSSPMTDGAAAIWVGSEAGMAKLPPNTFRVRLVDYELASVDSHVDGLLMAPAFAVPRLLARQGLTYSAIDLWEVHEAFAAQLAFHMKSWDDEAFLSDVVKVSPAFGKFPRDRVNPNGGSVALGHPFGATGAGILSQAIKELSIRAKGTRAIVSICADGGLGAVALLEV